MCRAKKAVKWILFGCTLFGMLLIFLVVYHLAVPQTPFASTSSPAGIYTVNLTGRKDRPRWPIPVHTVRFNLLKNGKPFLSDKFLHSGDWMDPSFEVLYPQRTWVNDNVLHFYRQEYFDRGIPDTLIIANNAGKTINYLRVKADGMFLLLDTRPGYKTTLSDSPSRGDDKWISVEGEFSDGRSIKANGVSFIISKDLRGPFTFLIYINDNASTIESSQLEKYKQTD